MSERKPCIRCDRSIDAWSRICPYCNWDQNRALPAQSSAAPPPAAAYQPPEEVSLKTKGLFAGAGVLLLVLSFLVGMIINRDGAPKNAPEPLTENEEPVSAPRRADTLLVPMNEPGGIEQPITSAPLTAPEQGMGNEWERSDATAVSSVEYVQLAKRASAEKKTRTTAFADPRSITGTAYAQSPMSRPRSQESQRIALRTRPVPQYQPVPRLRGVGKARLDLMVGPDGRVQDINVRRTIAGDNAALIGAVQRWRFKPATENGHPVSAPFSVEISFPGHD